MTLVQSQIIIQEQTLTLKNKKVLLCVRLILLQENNEKQEERLAKYTLELAAACKR